MREGITKGDGGVFRVGKVRIRDGIVIPIDCVISHRGDVNAGTRLLGIVI